MITKKNSNFDVPLCSIGLGTGDFFWNASIENNNKIYIIQKAIENGINLIDTAEEYGYGISEKIVAESIKGLRDKVIISSKFSPENHRYQDVINSCEKSLKRLKTDTIDIYQMHWPNPSVPIEETLSAMKTLYNDGKIKSIGMSNYSLREIKKAQNFLSETPLSFLQMEYNLFERTIEKNGIMNFVDINDMLILGYSPFDQGQFSYMAPNLKKILFDIGDKYKKTIEQVILNFLVNRKSIISITRTISKKHLINNIESMEFKLSKEEIRLIEKIFPIQFEEIAVNEIMLSLKGEWDHKIYQTLEEAIDNKLKFTPSPIDLAKSLKKGDYLKPVRLKPIKDPSKNFKYELVGGRIRFWAWVIAFGNKSFIPAYIRNKY